MNLLFAQDAAKPIRHDALAPIRKPHRVERDSRRISNEDRYAARGERSLPILQEFKTWLDAEREKLLPKIQIG